jgi:hypothetical protein
MLTEIPNTRQIPGEPFRRWFAGSYMDLIVWYDDDRSRIFGFQLCYRKGVEDKALTWYRHRGYSHNTVDDGEERPGQYKMSPIMIPDGVFHRENVLELFLSKSKHIDPELVEFIADKIEEYPGT